MRGRKTLKTGPGTGKASLVPSRNYAREKLRLVTFDVKLGPEVAKAELIVWSRHVCKIIIPHIYRYTCLLRCFIVDYELFPLSGRCDGVS